MLPQLCGAGLCKLWLRVFWRDSLICRLVILRMSAVKKMLLINHNIKAEMTTSTVLMKKASETHVTKKSPVFTSEEILLDVALNDGVGFPAPKPLKILLRNTLIGQDGSSASAESMAGIGLVVLDSSGKGNISGEAIEK